MCRWRSCRLIVVVSSNLGKSIELVAQCDQIIQRLCLGRTLKGRACDEYLAVPVLPAAGSLENHNCAVVDLPVPKQTRVFRYRRYSETFEDRMRYRRRTNVTLSVLVFETEQGRLLRETFERGKEEANIPQ